jgi:hypothetical protein
MRRPIKDTATREGADERYARKEPAFSDDMYPVPPDSPRRNWREEVTDAATLNLLAGIWLIIAPWVLAYSSEDPRWNDVVFGALVVFFALLRLTGAYRQTWMSWLNALFGVWIFIAAFTIDVTATAAINDVILGAIVFLLSIWSASASESRPGLRARAPRGDRYHGVPRFHH